MNNDLCIFYHFGSCWAALPARQQYLMAALSKYVPVIFFDWETSRRFGMEIDRPLPNLTVVRGLTRTCAGLDRRGQHRLAVLYADWRLRRLRRGFRKVIFWCAENCLCPYRFIRHDALIFDCIDPCFSDDPRRIENFRQRDARVMAEADCVFATADELADFCRQHHPRVQILNNACAPADYEQKLLDAAPRPAWWPATDRPIGAYLGSLDGRFDFDATERACRAHPDVHFVLAGQQTESLQPRARRLAELPNVTLPGRISVSDGRYLVNRCAIGLIPFTVGKMNDAINPVKMYLYALLGKPMAGTAVRELVQRPQIVATGDFTQAVSAALAASRMPDTAARLRQFAAANTWEIRAQQAWETIRTL